MALTRARVEAELARMAHEAEGRGIATADRNGQALSPRAIEGVYRDVKRCLFCGQRSSTMTAGALSLAPPATRFFPGPNERQVRLLFYGMCRGHETQVARDPQPWAAKARKVVERRLAERVTRAARTNAIYQVVMLGGLAHALEELAKPKPRGRPRKARQRPTTGPTTP